MTEKFLCLYLNLVLNTLSLAIPTRREIFILAFVWVDCQATCYLLASTEILLKNLMHSSTHLLVRCGGLTNLFIGKRKQVITLTLKCVFKTF